MKHVLITGCAGFIGSHLCEYFLKKDFTVIGLDNLSTGTQENLTILEKYQNFQFAKFDITLDWAALDVELPTQSLVFHLASPAAVNHYQQLAIETMWANSVGLGNALKFATQNNARLIFASTSEVYGSPQETPQSEAYWGNVNPFGERSCYDESKRFGEALLYTWNRNFGTQHGLVRIFNTYGPRMNSTDGRVLQNFVRQALSGKKLTLYGDGEQSRSFCYIDDLILGLEQYANSKLTIPVNLGNDCEIKILDLSKLVIELTQSNSEIVRLPLPSDDPPHRRPDLTVARKFLQYDPKISIVEGINFLISHFRAEY